MIRDEALREKFLSSEAIYPGKIIRVEKWQVELPNGETAMREIVRHNGASAIVPVDDQGMVTLVRQHRVAIGQCTWEIPAGKLDSPSEDPFAAAKRELEEETGLQAAEWRKLTSIYTTPGFCNEQIAIYLATGLSQRNAHPDEDEFLGLTKMPLSEAVSLCMSGEFRDSKTVIGLLMAQQVLAAADKPLLDASTAIQRFTSACSSREAK
ncbi:MAG: NUDIX hydrolase [Clostridia bacterium]|nr:NUDIX hydrolase [Clostridia bacterium]